MTTNDELHERSSPACRRRQLLRAGGVGVAAIGLAACGDSSAGTTGTTTGSGGGSGTATTVAAADVPVGGGVILPVAKVVVTQPSAGEFKAFTAICTHQFCTVTDVTNGRIHCSCHQSEFSITDGSVLAGPATSPLAAKTVTDTAGTLSIS